MIRVAGALAVYGATLAALGWIFGWSLTLIVSFCTAVAASNATLWLIKRRRQS